jgi:ABC-type multidrug transport system fused ATPase/permease subunit
MRSEFAIVKAMLGSVLGDMGFLDQAVMTTRSAVEFAREPTTPFLRGWTLHWLALVCRARGDIGETLAAAQALESVVEEYGLSDHLGRILIARGWATARKGQLTQNIEMTNLGLETLRAALNTFNGVEAQLTIAVLALTAGDAKAGLAALQKVEPSSTLSESRFTFYAQWLKAYFLAMLALPMTTLGNTWAAMQLPAAGLRRIHSVLNRLEANRSVEIAATEVGSIDSLALRDVSVGYTRNAPILNSISFQLNRGEMVALAGPSGTGKTTLILALPGFLPPLDGQIIVNGLDSNGLAVARLRSHMGFVFQQEALFSATIEDNIRYGLLDAAPQQVRAAATMAGAAEFIESLPDGYATMLGRRGTRLSVGQKQRIAIARALLASPSVLILDEPTAPLDPVSEAALIKMLRDLAHTRIVIIVAHRASTLAACDRVLFVHQGQLEAAGSHVHLLESSSSYRAYLAATGSEIHD